jgi:dihydroxy-acid dehydratase
MEDFYFAGGLLALLNKLRGHLDLGALTVSGRTLGETLTRFSAGTTGSYAARMTR